MSEVSDLIKTTGRELGKKGAARKLRASGLVPAAVYGPLGTTQHVALEPGAFVLQRQKYGRAHLYDLVVDDGAKCKAYIKEVQRNPVTRDLLHVDFYRVDMSKAIKVWVRIELTGRPQGVVEGGVLTQYLRGVELQGLPGKIPDLLTLDVSGLGMGKSVHLSDLRLPEGIKTTSHHDDPIAAVVEPEVEKEETTEAAAPAAGAAAPAASKPTT